MFVADMHDDRGMGLINIELIECGLKEKKLTFINLVFKLRSIMDQRTLACVANICVGLVSKERQRNRIFFMFCLHEKWCLPHFVQGQNIETPVPWSFIVPQPHGNTCYAG